MSLHPVCLVLAILCFVLLLGYLVAAQKFFSKFRFVQIAIEKTVTVREWQVEPRTGRLSILPFLVFIVVVIAAVVGILWAVGYLPLS